ncbi:single-stranded DNA-binding protein [Bavariicoccus seileri]|uniref:single-stranded DNA-binding protein n=1 Tax=Bavariicoccus seileri TaxID=549685 RepID=UPI0003B691DA|nr:single-stranded DNA-binding protein [Bavariicoccus seileri]
MINNVVLVGRLTKPVDLRYTANGTAVGSFTLAVNRSFTNRDGERETDFINCVLWRKAAENFANFTRKGSLVGIEGSIQTRNYENQQGQRVYVTEVLASNFSLLESRSVTEQRPAGDGASNDGPQNSYQNNNNTNYQSQNNSAKQSFSNDPFSSNDNDVIDISDDDLPF